jgi:tetrahydromethanopterin S-methyltransferase subunit G
MAEPDNMILPLLREIRAEINGRFDSQDQRFERIEKRLDAMHRAINGESVLGRYAAAEVDERLDDIEKRLAALEGRS